MQKPTNNNNKEKRKMSSIVNKFTEYVIHYFSMCKWLTIASMLKKKSGKTELEIEKELFEREKERFEQAKKNMERFVDAFPNIIHLDVGGVHYTTTRDTLRRVPNSLLDLMFSGNYPVRPDRDGRYFIDRNGKLFAYVLDYLRVGEIELPKDKYIRSQLIAESQYYGLDMVPVSIHSEPTSDWTITQSSHYAGCHNTADSLKSKDLMSGIGTNNSPAEWLIVHFKEEFEFKGYTVGPLMSGGWDTYTNGIVVEYSVDGVSWTNQSTISCAPGQIQNFQLPEPVVARQWRFSKPAWFAIGHLNFY